MKPNLTAVFKAYPAFCIPLLAAVLTVCACIGLAVQRSAPEVTLSDLEGDPALLDEFPLTFLLVDTAAPGGAYAVQRYELDGHTLTCRTVWQTAEEIKAASSLYPGVSYANLPETVRESHPLAAFEHGTRLLTITHDRRDIYRLPDEFSAAVSLDAGYLLTVYDRDRAEPLYRGRLNTWCGEDEKMLYGAADTPLLSLSLNLPESSLFGRRQLTGFCLKGEAT